MVDSGSAYPVPRTSSGREWRGHKRGVHASCCRLWPSAQASVEPWKLKGASRFSMKNTGHKITCEGKRSFLDAPLQFHVVCGAVPLLPT
jgi:hypothetical protein